MLISCVSSSVRSRAGRGNVRTYLGGDKNLQPEGDAKHASAQGEPLAGEQRLLRVAKGWYSPLSLNGCVVLANVSRPRDDPHDIKREHEYECDGVALQ